MGLRKIYKIKVCEYLSWLPEISGLDEVDLYGYFPTRYLPAWKVGISILSQKHHREKLNLSAQVYRHKKKSVKSQLTLPKIKKMASLVEEVFADICQNWLGGARSLHLYLMPCSSDQSVPFERRLKLWTKRLTTWVQRCSQTSSPEGSAQSWWPKWPTYRLH